MHIRCRKYIGGRLTGRSSGVNKTSSSSQQNNTNNTIANSRSGAGTGRVPFHRRSPLPKTETWRTCIKTKSNSAPRFVLIARAVRNTQYKIKKLKKVKNIKIVWRADCFFKFFLIQLL